MSSAVTVPSGSGPAIQFKDVRIGFDEGDIFRGVSFRVEPRETMILLGETGTGKTLTLQLAAGLLAPSEGVARVLEVLRFVGLEQTLEMLPSELSGGMRRRVSIARALINQPPIVLYDSPTAGLDPITSQTIITLILRLRDVYGVTA